MDTLYWLINTQTLGGMVVLAAFCGALVTYIFMVRWIAQGAQEDHK